MRGCTIKTKIFKINPKKIDARVIKQAAQILNKGGIVAFPTETVYGLGASANNKSALDRLYKIKARPSSKPFSVHISRKNQIKDLGCVVNKNAKKLIDKFWPGPLALIFMTDKGKTIGVRFPDDKVALRLLKSCRNFVVAPSANLRGEQAPYSGDDVIKYFDGAIDIILDAGKTTYKRESTILDVTTNKAVLIREGAIGKDKLKKYL